MDDALERMRLQLQDLMVEEYHRDYAMDVERLRREVELIFLSKLGKVGTLALWCVECEYDLINNCFD